MSIQDIIIKIKGRVGEENLCKIRLILPFIILGVTLILLLAVSFIVGRIAERRSFRRPATPVVVELPPYIEPYTSQYGSVDEHRKQSEPAATALHNTSTTQAFITSKSGKVYYPAACKSINRIKPENRVYYSSSSELIARGYTLSKTCTQ